MKYRIMNHQGKFIIEETIPHGHSQYLASYRNGEYKFVRDYLYAKTYSLATARKHCRNLNEMDDNKGKVIDDLWTIISQSKSDFVLYGNLTKSNIEEYATSHPLEVMDVLLDAYRYRR